MKTFEFYKQYIVLLAIQINHWLLKFYIRRLIRLTFIKWYHPKIKKKLLLLKNQKWIFLKNNLIKFLHNSQQFNFHLYKILNLNGLLSKQSNCRA
jgi:hypothetical protein